MSNIISKFFDMKGCISRKQFILRYIVLLIYVFILNVMKEIYVEVVVELAKMGVELNDVVLTISSILIVVLAIFALIINISLIIRRLYDLDKPKGLIILAFIPLVNFIFLFYLMLAKSKNKVLENRIYERESIVQQGDEEAVSLIYREPFESVSMNSEDLVDGTNEKEQIRDSKPTTRVSGKKKFAISLVILIIVSFIYINFFHYPHNGRWVTELNSHKIELKLNNGEGTLKIYYGKKGPGVAETKDVLIFKPNKRDTIAGIGGKSNRINVNSNVLILELDDIDTVIGRLDETLYFKKVR